MRGSFTPRSEGMDVILNVGGGQKGFYCGSRGTVSEQLLTDALTDTRDE